MSLNRLGSISHVFARLDATFEASSRADPGNLTAQHRAAKSYSGLSEGIFLLPAVEKPTLELEHAELALVGETLFRIAQEELYRDRKSVHGFGTRVLGISCAGGGG
jgi:hypothetical protein